MKYKGNELKYIRVWRKNNPDKVKALSRRSTDNARFGGLREYVLKRDRYRCLICRNVDDLTVDHIDHDITNNTMSNLQTLCRSCHGRKDGITRKITSGWHIGEGNKQDYRRICK